MRACNECRNSTVEDIGDYRIPGLVCRHELAKDPYDGDIYFKTCAWMRSTKGYCGIDGELFEPRITWWQRLRSVFQGS